MIYGPFGNQISVVRLATLGDVRALDKRKPDAYDKKRIADGCYLVTRDERGKERIYDVAYMKADGGIHEIMNAVRAVAPGMDPA